MWQAEKFKKRRPCIRAWLRHAFSDSAIALFGNLYVMALAGPQTSSYAVCYFSFSLLKIARQQFSTVGMPVFIGQSVVMFLSVDKQRFLHTGKNKGKVLLAFWSCSLEDSEIHFPSFKNPRIERHFPCLTTLFIFFHSLKNSLSHSETQCLEL